MNIMKVQNNGLKQDEKTRKVFHWLSSRASKMLYSPGSAVNTKFLYSLLKIILIIIIIILALKFTKK